MTGRPINGRWSSYSQNVARLSTNAKEKCSHDWYYSHITQTDGRPMVGEPKWENRAIVGRRRHRVWQIFWSADNFFVEAPKLKVSLTDPPIFRGFVIGEASGDDRRWSADIGRWHFIKEPSADRRQISAVIRPMIARLSANHKLWFVLYYLQYMCPHYLRNYIILFSGFV